LEGKGFLFPRFPPKRGFTRLGPLPFWGGSIIWMRVYNSLKGGKCKTPKLTRGEIILRGVKIFFLTFLGGVKHFFTGYLGTDLEFWTLNGVGA